MNAGRVEIHVPEASPLRAQILALPLRQRGVGDVLGSTVRARRRIAVNFGGRGESEQRAEFLERLGGDGVRSAGADRLLEPVELLSVGLEFRNVANGNREAPARGHELQLLLDPGGMRKGCLQRRSISPKVSVPPARRKREAREVSPDFQRGLVPSA